MQPVALRLSFPDNARDTKPLFAGMTGKARQSSGPG